MRSEKGKGKAELQNFLFVWMTMTGYLEFDDPKPGMNRTEDRFAITSIENSSGF